jgi:hypothetical protein
MSDCLSIFVGCAAAAMVNVRRVLYSQTPAATSSKSIFVPFAKLGCLFTKGFPIDLLIISSHVFLDQTANPNDKHGQKVISQICAFFPPNKG